MFTRVAEFHRVFDHPVSDVAQLPEQSLRDLRIRLIEEELEEYCTAFAKNDRIEMADALADLLFVLAGAAVVYGIAPDKDVNSPYEGMAPVPNMAETYDVFLRTDFASYLQAEADNDLEVITTSIFHMMVEIFGIARQSGIPINAVFAEVCRSNMSKLMPDGSVLRRDDGKILKGPDFSPPDIAAVLDMAAHA